MLPLFKSYYNANFHILKITSVNQFFFIVFNLFYFQKKLIINFFFNIINLLYFQKKLYHFIFFNSNLAIVKFHFLKHYFHFYFLQFLIPNYYISF